MIMLAPSRARHISHTHWHLSQDIEPLKMKIRHLPAGLWAEKDRNLPYTLVPS